MGALRDGRIDLDVGTFRSRDPEVQTLELSRQQLLVALRPDLLPAGKLTLRRYAALQHLAVAPRPGEASPVDEALAAQGLRRQVLLTLPSAHTALVAASRSQLAATVPSRIARAMAPGLGLQLHDLPLNVQVDPMLMAWHPRHGADPAHGWLRDCVQKVITDPRWQPPNVRPVVDPPAAAPPAARRAASGAPGRSAAARARP
jgi:DNA-binding transcriptional LysR family regulator